jgi:UDPglucose 6-dehydrogenase
MEAELAKYTHNCFGAMKVTYFNMIKRLCDAKEADFEKVKQAAKITGFLGEEHMQVPGHDGKLGYSGKCFPTNMESLENHLKVLSDHRSLKQDFTLEANLIGLIRKLNFSYRGTDK